MVSRRPVCGSRRVAVLDSARYQWEEGLGACEPRPATRCVIASSVIS